MAIAANSVILEAAAQELVESTANHPFLLELGPEQGRTTLDDLQAGNVAQPRIVGLLSIATGILIIAWPEPGLPAAAIVLGVAPITPRPAPTRA